MSDYIRGYDIVTNFSTLVIASFWKSSQLRKKLCHFMIMVLLCVLTNYPGILLYLVSWLRKDYDWLRKMAIYLTFVSRFLGFSTLNSRFL